MADAAQFTLGLFDNAPAWSEALLSIGTTGAVGHEIVPTGPMLPTYDDEDDADNRASRAQQAPASQRGSNVRLEEGRDRGLARGWPARARDNLFAIKLSKQLDEEGRVPTPDEQDRLLRFVGFGASELAQNAFPLPGATAFRTGWEETGEALRSAVTPEEYTALKRATQYAHYTPEYVVRALWRTAQRLGFAGGRVLEPGMGTGLFLAMLPDELRGATRFTGVEYDPVTARIARLLHPEARVRCEDYTRSKLPGGFDLAIGNPPFADRPVRSDPSTASLGLRLHDWFIAASVRRLRPGGIALFVTSTGTMDKGDPAARQHIAGMADLLGAVRLPEGSMRAAAGTDVVVDLLAFRRRAEGQEQGGEAWTHLAAVAYAREEGDPTRDGRGRELPDTVEVNEYWAKHPEMVLGAHAMAHGMFGVDYTCRKTARSDASCGPGATPLEERLAEALGRLPEGVHVPPDALPTEEDDGDDVVVGTAADGAALREGSFLIGAGGRLAQVVDGRVMPVPIREGKGSEGITPRTAKQIRALLPIRDALREVLRAQAADRPWQQHQVRLRVAYSAFIRYWGPINHTVVSVAVDPETGEEREAHRRPNLAAFADDPDCWLVASIEDYDLDTGLARMGPVFRERVVSPPAAPSIASAADALAVCLNEAGRVDPERIASLLETGEEDALAQLGTTVFRNPRTERWETADAYLSGPVRDKLRAAEAAAAADPQYARNVEALRGVQPVDLRPSDIAARLGAPWIPADVVEAFTANAMGTAGVRVLHNPDFAAWTVEGSAFAGTAEGTSEWGTPRRHAGHLLSDALNGATPQIYDVVVEDGREKRVLNPEATEAAKEKLFKVRQAFAAWVWTCPERADRLARIYNDAFNGLVARHFDGSHLTLPGASATVTFRTHQKRGIWRIVATGNTYVGHCVGAGKTMLLAAAVMEQRRLGLVSKAMLVVPGHCLAQASREFLQLYPQARILVADETNFTKDRRSRFLARAATGHWDAIIITHSAFRFIAVPAAFERRMIEDQVAACEATLAQLDAQDRVTRKRAEALMEKLAARLEAVSARRDDMLTLDEIGIDQLLVDEAQEFRKLAFATVKTGLKGVDPDGSARAWDLFVKSRFVATRNPGRALVQASGTPITNTLGELYTLLRFQCEDALRARGIHEFDAWAAAFGETRTELELQPSGAYKPVERFSEFINVPELVDLFRSVADVVQKDDLRGLLRLPALRGGQRTLVTAPATDAFRAYQRHLARRIELIEQRKGRVRKGDDILLSVITDGRHAAIDLRLAERDAANEPGNKLNLLVRNAHRIWQETRDRRYLRPDGTPYPVPGAAQMIFSDLGTTSAEATRGFSAYRWIKQELVRLGVPAEQVAYMQDYRRAADKQRLFGEVNAGRVSVLLGSSQTMGTGVNAQQRLVALHHLDVPWLPSEIEQREGRIERQGNQNEVVDVFAYATLGSMDATMWQNNERKARFIAAALSGDRSIRRLEDLGGDAADQFAMAKAIASGDGRLLQKAGLEGEVARLRRQRAAHLDGQLDIRRRILGAREAQAEAGRRSEAVRADLARRESTRGEAFRMQVQGLTFRDRREAGAVLLSKLRLAELEQAIQPWTVARIGGFDLTCAVRVTGLAGMSCEAELLLERTGWRQAVPVPGDLTAFGLVSRLEHVLDRFEGELEEQERGRAAAAARIAGYEPRLGEPFPLEAELDDKLAQLAALDRELGQTRGAHESDAA